MSLDLAVQTSLALSERDYMNLKPHPIAERFPLMQPDELASLVASISRSGLRVPIVIYEGKILDGRNRYRACQQAGVAPKFVELKAGENPWYYVWDHNAEHRELPAGQKAAIWVDFATDAEAWDAERRSAHEAANRKRSEGRKPDGKFGGKPPSFATVQTTVPDRHPEKHAHVSAAKATGVSPRTAAAVLALKSKAPDLFAAVRDGKMPLRQAEAEKKRRERDVKNAATAKENQSLPAKARHYAVLYVDPPWRYEHCETENRAIENQYPTMALDEIKQLKVNDLATQDAVLFCWATSPKLAEAMEVITAWGFTYRTCAVWDKEKIGMGYYFRQQHELLLVATKGSPSTPPPDARPSSVLREPRGKHSAKPIKVYEMIEAMYPSSARVELFARAQRDGWDVWGNEAHR